MAIDISDRVRICAMVEAERAAILKRWPKMPSKEVDRRARLKTVLKATAEARGVCTKKARAYIAQNIGRSVDHLKMVIQGNRRLGDKSAVALVSMFPELLALEDVMKMKIPDVVCLHRIDLPQWQARRAA